jgi:hypothetical protein
VRIASSIGIESGSEAVVVLVVGFWSSLIACPIPL